MNNSEILKILKMVDRWEGIDHDKNGRYISFSFLAEDRIYINNYNKIGDEPIEGRFELADEVLTIRTMSNNVITFYLHLEPMPVKALEGWYRFNLIKNKGDKPDYFSAKIA